ncbi:alpha-(1-_3)-arabinofuranosyltransferase family protein [Streptomyces sp. NBRC 110028]|uniref:alpha-(1->3)-arabinofuranosyltransferase domain-containing protein n=1 Tax=Streptomyces sp. NBRC 110028 TaxID=1621260 RepID=UPI0007C79E56|nr:alpha-(1->3)-arabinofuranosyltransferase family protein [Streptomyces sp. NBRC 110028]
MTQVVPSPPRSRTPAAPPPTAPGERPRGRRWLVGFWAAVLVAFLAPSPGRMSFDTKLPVVLDPFGFLADLGSLWHDRAGFGGIADQYVGYAFPMLPYYALAHLLHIPVWFAERLWMSLIVTVAFWGALRLAERLRAGSPAGRLLGAAGYALWPVFTIVVGSTSAAALPGALLPWVVLPLTDPASRPRIAAARSALLVPCMGGVNAASTLASLLPVALYLLSRPAGRRQRALLGWWIPGVLLATLWWVVPLLLLGVYGENFLPYIEQADTTTATMSATEMLRGAGNWVAYLHFGEAWLPGGWTVAASVAAVLGSGLAAALGLAGLARRDLPERRWLLLVVLSVALITLAGYGGTLGGPFHEAVRGWLDGWLRPFRNVYKFQTGPALALALGLAHVVGVAATGAAGAAGDTAAARPRLFRGRRFLPAVLALLLLPALAWPYLNGTVLQPGRFSALPSHWKKTADWLDAHAGQSRALVVPATAHGLYTWGSPIDQPLDVLAESRWAQRDFVPFGTAGSRRALDAVEQALLSGGEVPGLRDFLARAGLHEVVVRNDLDPDQIGYVPPQTVARTLEASGYRKVAGFGPLMTGGRIAAGTPVQVQGLFPRRQAVEIYQPEGVRRPGAVAAKPVSRAAAVSGGPESLLQLSADPSMADRPTVLTGDRHPGTNAPALQAVGDGMRRADTRFGLVNSGTSYTYTADERNPSGSLTDPGDAPRQILPKKGTAHQTTATLRGALSVTASSSGNWLFQLPQYDPVGAFDGNPDTAWAEGSAGKPVGQWLRIEFARTLRLPDSLQLTPLPGDGMRAAPTSVRVETDNGSADSPLQPHGTPQPVKVPSGPAKWLKITITGSQTPRPGLSGAGFSEVSVPGVQVTRLLSLPADAERSKAPAEVVSLHRSADPGGLAPVSAEVGLHRQFRTGGGGTYAIAGQALAVPGGALDALLNRTGAKGPRIEITADSTSRTGTALSARNLLDGDLTTAWIAGDSPVLHLRWPEKRRVSELVLAAAGGLSTRPEEVLVNSPDGAATAGVDANGWVRFPAFTTDRLDITISKTAPLTLHNPVAGQELQLPVGLTEVGLPELGDIPRVTRPSPKARFSLPCGQGPALAVDGTLHATKVSGPVRDLTERRPVKVELCGGEAKGGRLRLDAGRHTVEAGDAGPLALTDVTLTRGKPATAAVETRTVRAEDWSGDRRTVEVTPGQAVYLQTYENHNDGWKATLNGHSLTPLRVDGWQQAFLVPAGQGGTVTLTYEPATTYHAALVGGAAALLVLAGLAFARRRGPEPEGAEASVPPAPGWVLGTLALTAVMIAVAGWLALAVPLLALLARYRPILLPPTALVAMAAATVVAATGAGEPAASGEGAFSGAAQALALVALTAAVVTPPSRAAGHASHGAPPPPPPTGAHGARRPAGGEDR